MVFFSLSRKVRDDLPESLQRMSTPLFDHTKSICDPPELNRVTRRTLLILISNFWSLMNVFIVNSSFINFSRVFFYYKISQVQNRFG